MCLKYLSRCQGSSSGITTKGNFIYTPLQHSAVYRCGNLAVYIRGSPIYGILCLQSEEIPPMAALRFIDLRSHPMEFLDFTSLTPGEFPQLVLRLPYKFL